MGGRGSSNSAGGGAAASVAGPAPPALSAIPDWGEAFAAGVDFENTGDVNHNSRTVSRQLQQQWDDYVKDQNGGPVSNADYSAMMKEYNPRNGELYGYVRTTNSFAINQQLYDPNNADRTVDEIFGGRRSQQRHDLATVQALDRNIASHSTSSDATFTRYCSENAIQSTYGFSDAQMRQIVSTSYRGSATDIDNLSSALRGSTTHSAAYTSVSANRSMNAFSNPRASQSRGYFYERRIYTPSGTNAFAVSRNAQESEVIFGRGMNTTLLGVTREGSHLVFHEMHDGYGQ